MKAGIEGPQLVIERMGDDGVAADMPGGGQGAPEREGQQGLDMSLPLMPDGNGNVDPRGAP
jgi:hypothetical protein